MIRDHQITRAEFSDFYRRWTTVERRLAQQSGTELEQTLKDNLAILYERLSRLDTALTTWERCLQCEVDPIKQRQIRLFMQELRQLQEQLE